MKVTICMCSKCTLMGANAIYDAVEYLSESLCAPGSEFCNAQNLDLEVSDSLGICKANNDQEISPVVAIDNIIYTKATAQEISEIIVNKLKV